jgi:hypothetical protein
MRTMYTRGVVKTFLADTSPELLMDMVMAWLFALRKERRRGVTD